MKPWQCLLLVAIGAALVVAGVAMVYAPAALVVAGAACAWLGLTVDSGGERR